MFRVALASVVARMNVRYVAADCNLDSLFSCHVLSPFIALCPSGYSAGKVKDTLHKGLKVARKHGLPRGSAVATVVKQLGYVGR